MIQLDGSRRNLPVYEQVVWRIKELCLRGVLKPGEKLPSVRDLAVQIVANPNTISKAYQELERQGVIETRPGKGTFVVEQIKPEPDGRMKADLQQRLRQVVIDAVYAGLTPQELERWLHEGFVELGGDPRA